MVTTKRSFIAALSAAFFSLCAVAGVFATPTTISMDLVSPGSILTGTNVLDGVYTGAYTALIGGVSTPVFCDDYSDNSYVPEDWTADVSTFSNLTGTKWTSLNNSTQLYEESAWLIEQMVNPANSSQVGDISFAVWGIFNNQALVNLQAYSSSNHTSDYSNALNWIGQAQTNFGSADLDDFSIYTADGNYPFVCPGYSQCPTVPPQEFMTYNASEPPFVAIFVVDFLLFGFAIVMRRRRRILDFVR